MILLEEDSKYSKFYKIAINNYFIYNKSIYIKLNTNTAIDLTFHTQQPFCHETNVIPVEITQINYRVRCA